MMFTWKLVTVLLSLGTLLGCSGSPTSPIIPPEVSDEVLRLFEYDDSAPLEIQLVREFPVESFMVQDITYASPMGGRVPAFLFLPEGEGPFPGLIIMHGLPSNRHDITGRAQRYTRMGAVVLIITAPWARVEAGPRDFPIQFTPQDSVEQVQLIVDLRRGVDLLRAHELVDGARIGFVGGSYGGAIGGLLAGVERRIVAYALVVGDGGVVTHFRTGGDLDRLPSDQRKRWLRAMEPIEPIRFVGRAAPAPLLFQNGLRDEFVSVHDAEKYQNAGSEPKTIRWYDSGHGLSPEASEFQAEWLEKWIGIDASLWKW